MSGLAKNKENVEEKQRREKRKQMLEERLKKSQIANLNCDRELSTNLTQVQIISNINDNVFDSQEVNVEPDHTYIDTVIVKDPEFNAKEMHLADKKLLTEFRIRKYNDRDAKHWSASFNANRFAIEIDGEVYKLNNKPENDLIMKIVHVEKCLNMIRLNPLNSPHIEVNYWPNVYLMSKQAFENFFREKKGGRETISGSDIEMPAILPFERWYLKYWMPKGGEESTVNAPSSG
jgi:hypothetical protein